MILNLFLWTSLPYSACRRLNLRPFPHLTGAKYDFFNWQLHYPAIVPSLCVSSLFLRRFWYPLCFYTGKQVQKEWNVANHVTFFITRITFNICARFAKSIVPIHLNPKRNSLVFLEKEISDPRSCFSQQKKKRKTTGPHTIWDETRWDEMRWVTEKQKGGSHCHFALKRSVCKLLCHQGDYGLFFEVSYWICKLIAWFATEFCWQCYTFNRSTVHSLTLDERSGSIQCYCRSSIVNRWQDIRHWCLFCFFFFSLPTSLWRIFLLVGFGFIKNQCPSLISPQYNS